MVLKLMTLKLSLKVFSASELIYEDGVESLRASCF